jgi:hypothetical protein
VIKKGIINSQKIESWRILIMSATAATAETTKSKITGLVREIKKTQYFLNTEERVMIEYCNIFNQLEREMLIAFSIPAQDGTRRSVRNGNYQPTIAIYNQLTSEDHHYINRILFNILMAFNLQVLESNEYSGWVEFKLSSKVSSN